MRLTRRSFLAGAAAGLALGKVPTLHGGPAHKYRTALIGSGWWGMNILTEAMASGRCRVAALCDVDETARIASAERVKDLSGDAPKLYPDFRDLLDREKPEIVIVATPDHWHALNAIAALKAGAHVFVEKPLALTYEQGMALVRLAEERQRILMVGHVLEYHPAIVRLGEFAACAGP